MMLVNSIMSAIPVYFMTCFKLPKWVIQRIDRLRKRFMWGKTSTNLEGVHLVNWPTVTLPRKNGGMGVRDLKMQNISLLKVVVAPLSKPKLTVVYVCH